MQKYNAVMQEGSMDCGCACLLTIIRYYKGNVPREYLRSLTNTTKDGTNAYNLLDAGRKLGFDTKGVFGDVLDIESKFLPCISHVVMDSKYNHFVVIFEIDKKNKTITISDPSKGIIKMDYDTFNAISTKNFLFFIPNRKIPLILSANKIKDIVTTFAYNNKNLIICIILISILFTFLSIITSLNMQFIIDKALTYNSKENLIFILIIMIVIYIFKNVISYIRNRLCNYVNHRLDFLLIKNVFSHILSLPFDYYKNRTSGDIISRLTDLYEVRDLISNIILVIGTDLVFLILTLIFMFTKNIVLTLITIVFMIVYYFLVKFFNKFLEYYIRKIKQKEAKVKSFMLELINGTSTLKGLNVTSKFTEKFNYEYDDLLTNSYECTKVVDIKKFLTDVLFSFQIMFVIFLGSNFVIDRTFSLGSLISYNSLLLFIIEPFQNVINFDILIKKSKIVIERISDLLSIDKENILLDTNDLKRVDGDIEIKKLSFSYGGISIFNNLSLKIKKGQKVVIMAPTGFGKSTLCKIIARYIKVDKGFVKIGDTDINDYNLWLLREDVTYVSQNEIIFADSLYNNINIRNTRDSKKLEKIVDMMLVNDITKLRNTDLSMYVSEDGANLSGGEKSRVFLSRCFLKESNIYIIDETLSSLDVLTEKKILKNIFTEFKDKTIIVISHRSDNNDMYDKVIELKG